MDAVDDVVNEVGREMLFTLEENEEVWVADTDDGNATSEDTEGATGVWVTTAGVEDIEFVVRVTVGSRKVRQPVPNQKRAGTRKADS